MENLLKFMQGNKDGYTIIGNKDNGASLLVKLEEYILVYEDGGKEIFIFNTDIAMPLSDIEILLYEDMDLDEMGEIIGEWYLGGMGRALLSYKSYIALVEERVEEKEKGLRDIEKMRKDLEEILGSEEIASLGLNKYIRERVVF